ncbi:MAG TPA: DUF1232 domain-containing protein [Chloroflexi bacterium]|nr:DUF1232 domain-containing protein [Chloroflexota bacterium]
MTKEDNDNMEMDSSLTTGKQSSANQKNPGFLREVWQQVRLVYYLLRDPDVPFYLKFLPFLSILYLLWPIDLVTDIAPVVGQLDDMAILLVGFKVFIELAPPEVTARHLNTIRAKDGYAPLEANQDYDEYGDDGPTIIIDPDPKSLKDDEV